MSNLITGLCSFKDLKALIAALADLLQDPELITVLSAQLREQGTKMSSYYQGQAVDVDFFVDKRHRNFRKTFQQSYNHIGFRKKGKTVEVIGEHIERTKGIIAPKYSEHVVKQFARKKGLNIRRKVTGQKIELTLSR